jgi:hypothetical protein
LKGGGRFEHVDRPVVDRLHHAERRVGEREEPPAVGHGNAGVLEERRRLRRGKHLDVPGLEVLHESCETPCIGHRDERAS